MQQNTISADVLTYLHLTYEVKYKYLYWKKYFFRFQNWKKKFSISKIFIVSLFFPSQMIPKCRCFTLELFLKVYLVAKGWIESAATRSMRRSTFSLSSYADLVHFGFDDFAAFENKDVCEGRQAPFQAFFAVFQLLTGPKDTSPATGATKEHA